MGSLSAKMGHKVAKDRPGSVRSRGRLLTCEKKPPDSRRKTRTLCCGLYFAAIPG